MQRFFLAATLGVGLIAASYPAGASQTIDPCHKKCTKYYQDDSRSAYGKCVDACTKGEVYNVPVNKKGSAAKPAQLSKGSVAETYRRLRDERQSEAAAADAQAKAHTQAKAHAMKANAMEVPKRRGVGASSGGAGSGDDGSLKGAIKRALEKLLK